MAKPTQAQRDDAVMRVRNLISDLEEVKNDILNGEYEQADVDMDAAASAAKKVYSAVSELWEG